MENPHEAGARHREYAEKEFIAKKEAKSLYRRMLPKIHPDHFNHGSKNEEIKKESEGLTKELNVLFSDMKKDHGGSWVEKLERLKEFEKRVNEFMEKVEAGKKTDEETTEKPEDSAETEMPETEEEKENTEKTEEEAAEKPEDAAETEMPETEENTEKTEKITGADLIGEEADKRIAELGKQLEEARRAYVAEDEKAEKIKLSMRSVLWKTLKIGGLGEYEKEHTAVKNKYEETLKAYKDEFLKAGLIEDAEDVKIMVDFLNITEVCSRESTRVDLKAENSSWWDKASNGYGKIIESYKNIGKDDKSKFVKYGKKILVGAVIGGGFALGGGVAAGAAGTAGAALGWRLFTMSVSATGFRGIFEGMADKKRIKDSAKEAEAIARNSKVEGSGEIYADLVSENLDNMIANIDQKMQKGKQTARARSLGAFLTAGIISNLGQAFGQEAAEYIKENIANVQWEASANSGGKSDMLANAEKFGGVHSVEAPVVSGENVIELDEFKTGGSIEKSIREYLERNPEVIEKYNASELSGGHKFNAGQIAFRMFDELSKDHDVSDLPVGTKINLSADGLHIKSISGLDLGEATSGETVGETAASGAGQSEVGASSEDHIIETSTEKEETATDTLDSSVAAENLARFNESKFGHNIGELINDYRAEIARNESVLGSESILYTTADDQINEMSNHLIELKDNDTFFEEFRNHVMQENRGDAADSFRNVIERSGGSKWKDIKDLTFAEAVQKGNWRTSDKLNMTLQNLRKLLSPADIQPKIGETMAKWTLRVSKIAIEQSKVKY